MLKAKSVAIAAAIAFLCARESIFAASIWQVATGTSSWNTAGNWNPSGAPSAVGAAATFNGAATGSNPAQTGNRTASLDGTKTVGSIVFNTDLSTFTNTISTGTGGPLVFDEIGTGPATITTMGSGTGNNTISVAMTLTDDLVGAVNNTSATSAAGSLNLTGTMSGAGGFTKNGDGLATFGTGAKTYAGATVLNGGRMRMSLAASPTATSSFTINAGAQLDLISTGTFTFGSGPLKLNGTGATSGPYAAFPGAIRNDTSLLVTITNPVELQTNTLLHVQATAGTGATATPVGSLTFTNTVSGAGGLTLTGPGSNVDQGILELQGANTYSGGTLVQGGILRVTGANATLGTGSVTVNNALSIASIARLQISAGVLNAIDDFATLSLAGGGGAGADQNYIDLGAGVNDIISGLVLGGVPFYQTGTYGSTASGATFQFDDYFSGTGVVTLVPEPSSMCLLALMLSSIGFCRRDRR